MTSLSHHPRSVAVIGMACRLPGSPSLEAFWANLRDGREGISYFSAEEVRASGADPAVLSDPAYVRAGAVIDGAELFDAKLFGVGVREAELMDPQHRVFLECAWEALEDAGYDPRRYEGSIGVYAGANRNTYLLNNLLTHPELLAGLDGFQISIASDNDYLTTRVSYKLDLRGPSVTVQSASSTSLVAVHLACRALQSGDCTMALAGGVAVKVPQAAGYKSGGVRSSDGHTRSFDARPHGTVFGSGAGVVVLKPLAAALKDGDHVYAVIRGSAVNNDGARKQGYTAPSADGVSAAVGAALAESGVEPDTIGYVEAHATGTAVGDPIEVDALTRAFRERTARRGFCALGSVKTNIGHPSAASGVAGLIKAALSLEHAQIPASLNFEQPNPSIDFADNPFYVNTALQDWPAPAGVPRRAGVSALGFGGTNAHVILEEAPVRRAEPGASRSALITLSAQTTTALQAAMENLARRLREDPALDLEDAAFTLQVGRRELAHRVAVVSRTTSEAADALDAQRLDRNGPSAVAAAGRTVAFVFPGHGSQHVGMAQGVYQREPLFRHIVDYCAERLVPLLGGDLRDILYPARGTEERAERLLAETRFTQPALFTVEYALGRLWMDWGVRPQALIGYSIGEYAAACLAEILTLDDALTVVAARATLAQRVPEGAMLAVALDEERLRPFLRPEVCVAAVSAPDHCIAAGASEAIDRLRERLGSAGVPCKRLQLNRAFHSAMLDPILDEYRAAVRAVRLRPPGIPLASGLTGTWLRPEQATDPEHWVRELRETVRFAPGIALLAEDPGRIFLEVGPGNLLAALVRGNRAVTPSHVVIASSPGRAERASDEETLLAAVGGLWTAGIPIDWTRFHAPQPRRRISLPRYPFERQRYWVEPRGAVPNLPRSESPAPMVTCRLPDLPSSNGHETRSRPALIGSYVAPESEVERRIAKLWRELLGLSDVGMRDRLYELGGDSLVAVQLVSRLREAFGVEMRLQDFLASPTVATMASCVAGALPPTASPLPAERLEAPPRAPAEGLEFSLFFFSGDEAAFGDQRYRLVLEATKFADRHGFSAVWTPERHFDKFGGLYPNPAVLGAALAMVTERIRIRAGSVVLPLQHPLRVAEEWAMVDNLSGGRTGLAFASGFHPRDFALAPDHFTGRKQLMLQGIDTVLRLWRGEAVRGRDGNGRDIDVRVYPRPVQAQPPIWLACTSSIETFVQAGRMGANVLTALLRFGVEELEERIALYRRTRRESGHDPDAGRVTVMLHTYLDADEAAVDAASSEPLLDYLRSHLDFLGGSAGASSDGSGRMSEPEREALLAHAFQRYSTTQALIGTPDSCLRTVERLRGIGVNELACLVDFGVEFDAAMNGLRYLGELRALVSGSTAPVVV